MRNHKESAFALHLQDIEGKTGDWEERGEICLHNHTTEKKTRGRNGGGGEKDKNARNVVSTVGVGLASLLCPTPKKFPRSARGEGSAGRISQLGHQTPEHYKYFQKSTYMVPEEQPYIPRLHYIVCLHKAYPYRTSLAAENIYLCHQL